MKYDTADLASLAETHGTPFFLYDVDQASDHVRRFQASLPESVNVYYAVKANPNRAIVRGFQDIVRGLDISSVGELELAKSVGWDTSVMSFAGPGKSESEIARALAAGVGSISVESELELDRIQKEAAALGIRARCLLRVNPPRTPKAFAMRMGGVPSQFGVPDEDAERVFAKAMNSPNVDLRGVHVFSGTQCLDLPSIVENTRNTLSIAQRTADRFELDLEEVNLGGGIGVAYFADQVDIDPQEIGAAIGSVVEECVAGSRRLRNTRFVLELGRYLVGAYGVYVTRASDVKEVRGRRFVVLDGGMHHCFAATGNFGQLIKKNYPVSNATRSSSEETANQDLVGPLCTPLDSMARSIPLPPCEVGDMIVFDKCGAYGFTASPLLFLSHPTPLELMRRDSKTEIVRRRILPSEFY